MEFINGGLAGAGATLFSNPLDLVKIRLQLQGELRKQSETTTRYRGTFHAMYVIATTEGPLALQKGLAPAMVLGFCMNSLRLGLFRLAQMEGLTKNKNGEINVLKTIFCSGLCGYMAAFASNPFAVLKTRLQAESHPSIAVGRQHHYKGIIDGFFKILKNQGFKGLYTGAHTNGVRLFLGSATQLTTFTRAKELLLSYDMFQSAPIQLAFCASAISGIAIVIIVCPIDVANVRLLNQGPPKNGKRLYTGLVDCLVKIIKIEGLTGLYKGMGPLYLRLAPHTTISLVLWDWLNHLLLPKL